MGVGGGFQTQQMVETHLGPEHLEHLPKQRVIQNGDTRDKKNIPTGRGVGYLHRFQRRILPYTNSQSVQEVHAFSHPVLVIPVQGTTLWSVHSTHGVHSSGQTGQIDGVTVGYKDPPVPRRLVGQSHIPPYLSPQYTDRGGCRELGWLVNREKLELDPKQVSNFVCYQFDQKEGKVRHTPECWQALTTKIQTIRSGLLCPRSGSSCPS